MLYVVPIIHSPEDLGSLSASADQLKRSATTHLNNASSNAAVREFWSELTDAIESWQIDYESLTVYQDALPVCEAELAGVEQQIIDELADKGSRNHQILQWLRERGAVVLGTESANLLIEEYRQMKELLEQPIESHDSESVKNLQVSQTKTLQSRDRFIANRIDTTLRDSQTGLIFLGMLHEIDELLPSDILAVYPFGRPIRQPFRF